MHSDELSERAITSLKGIGPARAEQFARMGLFSLRDLLGFMPRGYLDFHVKDASLILRTVKRQPFMLNSSVRQEQYAQKTERL